MEQQTPKMDKKSKILLGMFFIFILASILMTFYRTMIVRDYPIFETEKQQ